MYTLQRLRKLVTVSLLVPLDVDIYVMSKSQWCNVDRLLCEFAGNDIDMVGAYDVAGNDMDTDEDDDNDDDDDDDDDSDDNIIPPHPPAAFPPLGRGRGLPPGIGGFPGFVGGGGGIGGFHGPGGQHHMLCTVSNNNSTSSSSSSSNPKQLTTGHD